METVAEGLLDEILGGKLSREDAKTRREGTRRGDRWGENLTRRREGRGRGEGIVGGKISCEDAKTRREGARR